jgi:hypothetical protein
MTRALLLLVVLVLLLLMPLPPLASAATRRRGVDARPPERHADMTRREPKSVAALIVVYVC